jgi:tripartite-type tricarboxylate transporter receptor subunit TctC
VIDGSIYRPALRGATKNQEGTLMRKLIAFVAAMSACTVMAQGFPDRAIKIIVPFTPGGGTDVIGRVMADGISKVLKQPVVIENIGGASGNIGTARGARAESDGYTLTECTIGTCSVNGSLYKNTGYDIERNFIPVFYAGGVGNVVTVNNDFPGKSLADIVDYAKANPGKLAYGSSGIGASNHLGVEWLQVLTGTRMNHIPYKGSGPAITDLLAGHITLFFDNEPSILPYIKAGKARPLAVTGRERLALLPDVPTMQELGYKDYVLEPWFGFLAPAGTPKHVVDKLNAAFNTALHDPSIRTKLEAAGLKPEGGTPERLAQQIKSETSRWKQVIKANNIRVD